jgi:16S rRNA (guanine527-N7)-methyltransferase
MEISAGSISAAVERLGIAPDERQLATLIGHLLAVFEANKTMNLTSISESDAIALHVLDSLSSLRCLDEAPAGAFVDLGSGAGFPGIPLAVMSGREAALVESVRKKAEFLRGVIAELRLEATVHAIRAEELVSEMSGEFAAATARALASLPSLVELAAPLLQSGGILIAMKGRLDDDEVRRGDAAAELCGMRRESRAVVVVPGLDAARSIVTYRRVSSPRVRLPRRTGMAQRQPLA